MRSFRPSRKRAAGEHREEPEPLGKLRRRCTGGAIGASGAYIAVIATTVVRPSALSLSQIMGLEFGLFGLTLLCALVALTIWALTENTAFALSVFKAAGTAATANAVLENELLDPPHTSTSPIPIQRGQEIRHHRRDRHAV